VGDEKGVRCVFPVYCRSVHCEVSIYFLCGAAGLGDELVLFRADPSAVAFLSTCFRFEVCRGATSARRV